MAHKKTAKNPKGAGRPKGSKNKKSGPGRPSGSTNRHPGLRLALLHKRKRGPGRPRKHISHSEANVLREVPAKAGHKKVVIVGYIKTRP